MMRNRHWGDEDEEEETTEIHSCRERWGWGLGGGGRKILCVVSKISIRSLCQGISFQAGKWGTRKAASKQARENTKAGRKEGMKAERKKSRERKRRHRRRHIGRIDSSCLANGTPSPFKWPTDSGREREGGAIKHYGESPPPPFSLQEQ